MRDLLLAFFMLFAPIAQIDTAYTVEPVPEFADLRTVVFEGNVAEDAPSGEFQIHLGADCSAARLASTTDLIETDGDTRFRVTANAEAVAGYDRLAAALCVDAIDEPLSVQSFVLASRQPLWRSFGISGLSIIIVVLPMLLFEVVNGRHRGAQSPVNRALLLTTLACMVPVGLIVFQLHQHAVAMPTADDWDRHYFGSYVATDTHRPLQWIAYMWTLAHEGHRIFVPALVNTALFRVTHFDVMTKYFINIGIGFAIPWMVARTAYSFTDRKWVVNLLLFASVLLLFNPAFQWWLEARIFVQMLCVMGVVGALWAIAVGQNNTLTIIVVAVLALISSTSFFPGNLVWFVVIPMLWIAGYRRWQYYVLWGVLTVSVLTPLMFEIQTTLASERTSLPPIIQSIRGMVQFITMPFLDIDLVDHPTYQMIEIIVIISLLIAVVSVLRSGIIKTRLIPISTFGLMIGWVLATGAAVIVSRLTTFGATNPPRYEIYGVMFWCSVIGIVLITTNRRNQLMAGTAVGGLAICYVAAAVVSPPLRETTEIPRILRWCILEEEPRTDACNDAIGMHSINWYVEQPKVFWMVQRRTAAFEVDSYRLMPVHTGTGWNEWVREAFSPNSPDKPTPATVDTTVYEREIAGEPVHAVRATDDLYWEVYVPRNVSVTLVTQPVDGPGTYIVQVHLLTDDSNVESVSRELEPDTVAEPIAIDLSQYAGQQVRIILLTDGDPDTERYWLLPEVQYTLPEA